MKKNFRSPGRTAGLLAVCAFFCAHLAAQDHGGATNPAAGRAAVLTIHGEITDVTVESLKRRIELAQRDNVDTIVFELDTPGGLVTSSIAIADQIKSLRDATPPLRTVAWVNPNAISGGAIVAVAAEQIVMARSSRMGDSQVILGAPTGVQAVPEDLQAKVYTPVLAEFRASARLNGYDQVLCEAFVIPEREVWWLENTKTGKREFVFRDEKFRRLGEVDPDLEAEESEDSSEEDDSEPAKQRAGAETIAADASESEWKLVETYFDSSLGVEVDAIQPIVRDDQLLQMSPGEAAAYGFSKATISRDEELRAYFGLGLLKRFDPNWSESLAYWLTSLYVRGFLLAIFFLSLYVEFHTPGVGLAGLVALVSLAVFVAAPYLTGLANIWEILLIVAGVLLIAMELFVIPGFGVAGISGIVLMMVGLVATFVPDEPGRPFPLQLPSLPTTMGYLQTAVITVVSSLAASLTGMVVLSRYLPRMPVFNRMIPANPTPSEVLVDDPYRGAAHVGDVGRTEGPLHPSGKARFGGLLVDVVTQGEFLDANMSVEVVERRGNRVVVRATV